MNAYASPAARALRDYEGIDTAGRVAGASPHQLVMMLFDGAMDRIATARACMQRGEVAAKGESISRAIELVGCLRGSIDKQRGGDLAGRLDKLYAYISRGLLYANRYDDAGKLDELAGLLREVQEGWMTIPEPMRGGQP